MYGFLNKLFHPGRMPDELKTILTGDNLQVLEEGIKFTITFRNFKAPWKRTYYRKQAGITSIGYSVNYFIASTSFNTLISLPINDEKFRELKISNENNRLLILYDPHIFNEEQSGEIELRFYVRDIYRYSQFFNN